MGRDAGSAISYRNTHNQKRQMYLLGCTGMTRLNSPADNRGSAESASSLMLRIMLSTRCISLLQTIARAPATPHQGCVCHLPSARWHCGREGCSRAPCTLTPATAGVPNKDLGFLGGSGPPAPKVASDSLGVAGAGTAPRGDGTCASSSLP